MTKQQLAFQNGQFLPADQCSVPVYDGGFVQGVTVAEQQRTFNGKLFRLEEHIDRLFNSLSIVGVDPGMDKREFHQRATELAEHNFGFLEPGHDLGLCIFVTPGPIATFAPSQDQDDLAREYGWVYMHTYSLPFHTWKHLYAAGQPLVIPQNREVPNECWSSALKCRSRMHYFLADKEARQQDPQSRALLLDVDGNVSEASTASLFIYLQAEGLVAPPAEKILPSISMATIKELAEQLKLPFTHRELSPREVSQADEVMLCSTSPCVLPVSSLDGVSIGTGKPGPVFQQLISAWSQTVGLDIVKQAMASQPN